MSGPLFLAVGQDSTVFPVLHTSNNSLAPEAVNYDRCESCSAACSLGKALKVPVYKFLKDALIRKYGEDWYKELEVVAGLYLKEKSGA
ncbi:MAG: DUF3109 family protein [Bacteroidia bacterium]|nr:DUF3109 family protein [Bacteroidia bacterium]